MNDRYHRAARDGLVYILKQATRKELNTQDNDGMTPVLWAANHGNLEALQVMLGRGGDPDLCDIWGNTPLHLAAANGHLNCLSFLVSFGANVWCLDNDYHTPLDMAAVKGHMVSVRYLDSVAAKQSTLNPKLVRKLKESAIHNAEQRIKECVKLQHQNQRHLEKQVLKETMATGMSNTKSFSSYVGRLSSKIPRCSSIHSSITYTQAMLNPTAKSRTKIQKYLEKNMQSDRTFKISEDGRKSVRSLSGLQLGNDVMFLKQGTYSGHNQYLHVRSMFPQNVNHDVVDPMSRAVSDPGLYASFAEINSNSDSLFSRPGLGTLIFQRSYANDGVLVSKLYSASVSETMKKEINAHLRGRLRPRLFGLDQDSISTASLQDRNLQDYQWGVTDDEEDEYLQPASFPLKVFLESQSLSELYPIFLQQKMDLDDLMLCSESDLAIIDIPLGPRKKLLEACSRRAFTLQRARTMQDTQL